MRFGATACAGAAIALALALGAGTATAAELALGVKAGGLLEGAQNTLKSGAGGGVVLALGAPDRWQFEFGLTYGQDPGDVGSQDAKVTVWALDARARRYLGGGRVRPYAEVGLGLYDLAQELTISGVTGESSKTSLGGPLGAGAAIELTPQSQLRIGVEYHMIAAELPSAVGTSGNLEDYVWIGATYTFRLSGGN